jgi:zinc protease
MCRRHVRSGYRRATTSVFLPLVTVALAAWPIAGQETTRITEVEGITEYRLDNGLRFLLFPDASKPTATVNVTYFVGSRHEAYGETGMAHLLEHLVFKGTPDHPDIDEELTEHGARPNGTTSFDRTNYFETFPSTDENLEWALDLEADRMVNSFISGDDLESEMTVVRNEMESGENSPFGVLLARTRATAYLWHNYGKDVIGARSDVEGVPIDRLQAFYRKYYQPDNALLIVTGKFETERALELIADHFGDIPRPDRSDGNTLWDTYTREPVQDGERTVTLRRVGEVQIVLMSHHVPPGSHVDFAPIDILSQILGDQPSGRLYRGLVEPGLAASTGAFAYQLREAGPLLTFARVRSEDDLSAAVAAMDRVLVNAIEDPLTSEEVDRAKTALLNGFEQAFNNPERIARQLSEWAAMGDWRLFFLHRDRIEAVEPQDVRRVATEYLKPDNRTVGLFYPTDEPDRTEVPDLPDIDSALAGYTGREAVAAGEAFDPSPSNIEQRTTRYSLSNGIKVALLPKRTRGETVTASFRVILGDEEALMGRATAGSIAGQMLMLGSSGHTRQQIQDEFDRLRITGSVGGSGGQASGSVQTIRENLAEALRLMAEIIREPTFPQDEFETLKEQRLAGLEQQRSDPAALAQTALGRHMNPAPPGHPNYVATVDERVAALEAVTTDDARAFHRDFYGPQLGTLSVVGDFDPDEIRGVVEEFLGGWESPYSATRIGTPFYDAPAEVLQIETPDKANSFIFAQQNLALRDDDPDYPALILAGYMIGGGVMNSRLTQRIRQQDGLSYSVGGGIGGHPVDENGSFSAMAIQAPENAEKVEAALREEIQRVLDDGFDDDELAVSKRGYLQSRELSRAQDGSLVGMLNQGLYFERTLSWDIEYERRIQDLTIEDVNAAVRRHLDLSKMTIVKAGDFGATGPPVFP